MNFKTITKALPKAVSSMFKDGDEVNLDTSPVVADEVKCTTCYMCACRCGIKVHLKDKQVKYIEGNRDHPVNKGVLCGKGAAGIMQHLSPARLHAPMKRTGPRGSGMFEEISWDEALQLATTWLKEVRDNDPRKLAFFTGRDQSQSLTGWWASQFGTPNFAAHGGFCSVNMAAGGLYTFGGSFWEFGEPDWEKTEYFVLWGVAEDHASNPLKRAIGRLKQRGIKIVSINPIRTGYSAVADEWIGLRPGTDGLFAGALIHELMHTGKIDLDYLMRYTNAHWLVVQNKGHSDDGLFVRDLNGEPLAYDQETDKLVSANSPSIKPLLIKEVQLDDGRIAAPVLYLISKRFLDASYSPEIVAEQVGISALAIKRIAQEIATAAFDREVVLDVAWTDCLGRKHDKMIGRPVSMHAMRGISAHSNGFQTCRLIHLLQILLGSIDCPGGFRYKPPYPKSVPPPGAPAGKEDDVHPGQPLKGMPLGFVADPEDLLVNKQGDPLRIDKAYSWDAPLSAHGLMHMVINNSATQDPYNIDVLLMYMANMGWNSSMNIAETLKHLTRKKPGTDDYVIPKIIYSDAFYSETVPYADLILPDTTYLERWDCISILDRPISDPDAAIDAIRQPVAAPKRDVRPFQSVLLDLGARLGLPGMVDEKKEPLYPKGYADYIANHERSPGIGPLIGWRGIDGEKSGRGAPNQNQLQKYIENGCFYEHKIPEHMRYFKHANKDYLTWAKLQGFAPKDDPIVFQLYSETLQKFRLAAQGFGDTQPPESHKERILDFFDPIPFWYAPFESLESKKGSYPFYAVTQRLMHMYHSWGSQNAWLRQITNENKLYMNRTRAIEMGLSDDDWVWLTSDIGRVKCQIRLMDGCNSDTIWTWNGVGKRSGAWGIDKKAPEVQKGFLLNHLISELLPVDKKNKYRYSNSDPITGQAAWYDLRVSIEKAEASNVELTQPIFEPFKEHIHAMRPDKLQFGLQFKR